MLSKSLLAKTLLKSLKAPLMAAAPKKMFSLAKGEPNFLEMVGIYFKNSE